MDGKLGISFHLDWLIKELFLEEFWGCNLGQFEVLVALVHYLLTAFHIDTHLNVVEVATRRIRGGFETAVYLEPFGKHLKAIALCL